MSLLQLKYVLTVAQTGTISDAAKELFIAQPSLTSAIKDLETELGIEIFHRTRKDVTVTTEGEEFLSYARQVIEQANLIEEKYFHHGPVKHQFCVSCQHYSFTAEAFIELLKNYDGDQYDFRIRETTTYEIIEDVARLRSEIGVLYLNDFNKAILKKTLRENNLKFHSLSIARPHVFLSSNHPLAAKDPVTLEDLDPYPRLAYEQGTHNFFYFSEEILSTRNCKKDIMVRDRGTLYNCLIGLNGYTISSGIISDQLNGVKIVPHRLDIDDYMNIGYITNAKTIPGPFAQQYIKLLKKYTK